MEIENEIYGIVGSGLGYSLDAEAHALLGDPDYRVFEVESGSFADFVKKKEYDGLNISSEYGRTVMPLLSKTTENARLCGCADTVLRLRDGRLYGDNTAIYGFSHTLDFSQTDVEFKKCLVIGDGGDAAAVKQELLRRGARETVTILSKGKNNYENIARHADAEILVNTTPVGRCPNNGRAPFSLAPLTALEAVIDLIYNPLKSELIFDAESRSITAVNGIPMLAARAKRARELFYNADIDDDVLPPVAAALTAHILNITVIGERAAEVGRALAERLSRRCYDLLEIYEKLYGKMSLTVEKYGEAELFRSLRVSSVWAGRHTGVIITAPDETVRRENRRPLSQNGVIFGIGREDNGFFDYCVPAGAPPEETADAILAKIGG